MTEKNHNQRRACALARIDPRVYRRQRARPEDTKLRERLKELSGERRRFGYPLPGSGLLANHERGGCTCCSAARVAGSAAKRA